MMVNWITCRTNEIHVIEGHDSCFQEKEQEAHRREGKAINKEQLEERRNLVIHIEFFYSFLYSFYSSCSWSSNFL